MSTSRPVITHILETILYVDDVEAARAFYEGVLGLEPHGMASDLGIGYLLERQMLLLFVAKQSSQPGRIVPSHGANGAGHLAFQATPAELESWRVHLLAKGVEIEQEHRWDNGTRSIYFRDPAGNSLEFTSPSLWGLPEGD
jgi:catechol 2,3-dioxygenase-like lactoylglutathione lyase family enzyme